ncbi:MAG: DUF4234 domain-containing protein [Lachnospiraceae bacterium]|nr:DUF4234 domain-containing protein [Lachnospiraceae bacterium]
MEERKLDSERKFWKYIVFGIITCGIYDLIFWWKMIKDLNTACAPYENDDSQRSPNFIVLILLTIVTCGIYYFFWLYKQGNRIKRVGTAYGLSIDETGSTYLLWDLVGVLLCMLGPWVCMYYLVTNITKLCKVYNYQHGFDGSASGQGAYGGNPYGSQGNAQIPYGQQNNGGMPGAQNNGSFYYGQDPNTIATQRAPQSRTLLFIKGTYSGAEVEIRSGEELVIGRNGEACNFVLPDPDISRKHCTVRYSAEDGYFYVTDYSTFGVYMNGSTRLKREVATQCPPGTRLSLGEGNNVFILQ